MIEGKITINLNHKSKATSSRTYYHDHVQLRLHKLFYLRFSKHKLPVCDFEIPLKGFRSPLVIDLYVATYFHQFLIVNLVSVNACRVRRYSNLSNLTRVTHKSSKGF